MSAFKHVVFLVIALAFASTVSAGSLIEMLEAGRLADAEQKLSKALTSEPDNPTVTTQLGVVQMLQAVERLGQANHRLGVRSRRSWAPFFRLSFAENENPEVATYQDVRDTLQQLLDDLEKVESTLASVGDQTVKWNVDIARLRVDLNSDGKATEAESLGRIYLNLTTWRRSEGGEPLTFLVGIDTGDVYWLRGYCHLLSAMAETLLAYDQQEMFDHTAQLIFSNPKIKHDFLKREPEKSRDSWFNDALDGVAMLHLFDWPLKEPARLRAAHAHLLEVIATSKASWQVILSETDNDHEWIPNPDQESVLPRGTITQAQVDTWHDFLAEAEDLLLGEKLAPFWRDPSQGINLRRVFYEPQRFDLVLWVQGSATEPYLEKGEQTKPETWRAFQRVFRGRFLGFAFWIN